MKSPSAEADSEARNRGMSPPVSMWKANTSVQLLKSRKGRSKSEAQLWKTRVLPSGLKTGVPDQAFALERPDRLAVSRVVLPVSRSKMKISVLSLRSPGTMSAALLS